MQNSLIRLAFVTVALTALVGCGKAAPAVQPPVIDSVFSKMTSDHAQQDLAIQQQDRRDSETRKTDTERVDAPDNNKNS